MDERNADLERYRVAKRILLERPPFMVLTGAGISVESGLPPFRGPGGIWTRFEPEVYGHIQTFRDDPAKSWVLLDELIKGTMKCRPNEAHRVIARLEARGLAGPIVTQNIDGYHRAAGSKDILDVHGDASEVYCPSCGCREHLDEGSIEDFTKLCICGSYKRPDIVFYGEQLPEEKIGRAWDLAAKGVDILVVGTSGMVMPVAQLPFLTKIAGGRVVEINPYPSEISASVSDVHIMEKAVKGLTLLESIINENHDDVPKEFK